MAAQSSLDRPGPAKQLALFVMFAAACAVAFAINLSLPIHHDEFQYLAAAHLVPSLEMYHEYMYSQTPYYPYLLSGAQLLLAPFGISPHFAARLVNALASCAYLGLLMTVAWRLSGRSVLLVAAVLSAALASGYFSLSMQTARNDMVPLALYTASLLFVHRTLSARTSRERFLGHLSAAFLIGVAVCAKQSYAFLAVAYFVWAVIAGAPTWVRRLREVALPAAIGGAVAAIPAMVLILPNLKVFIFDVFTYHRTAHIYWLRRDDPDAIGIATGGIDWPLQLHELARGLYEPLALLNVLAVLALVLALGPRGIRDLFLRTHGSARFIGLLVLSAIALLISFVLARPFNDIYAPPLLTLLCVGAALVAGFMRERGMGSSPMLLRLGLAGFAVVSVVFGAEFLPPLSKGTPTTPLVSARLLAFQMPWEDPNERTHYQVHGDRVWLAPALELTRSQMQAALSPTDGDQLKIASVYSSTVIDAGYDIYPPLASAPFFFRGDMALYDDRTLEMAVGVRATEVAQWLEQNDAKAVLTAEEPDYGTGFTDYALGRGFTCFLIDTYHLYRVDVSKLYVDPSIANGPGTCPETDDASAQANDEAGSGS